MGVNWPLFNFILAGLISLSLLTPILPTGYAQAGGVTYGLQDYPALEAMKAEMVQLIRNEARDPKWKFFDNINVYKIASNLDEMQGDTLTSWRVYFDRSILQSERVLVSAFLHQNLTPKLRAITSRYQAFAPLRPEDAYQFHYFVNENWYVPEMVGFKYDRFSNVSNWQACKNTKDKYQVKLPPKAKVYLAPRNIHADATIGKCPITKQLHYFRIDYSEIGALDEYYGSFPKIFVQTSIDRKYKNLKSYLNHVVTGIDSELKPFTIGGKQGYAYVPRNGPNPPIFFARNGNRVYQIRGENVLDSDLNAFVKNFTFLR